MLFRWGLNPRLWQFSNSVLPTRRYYFISVHNRPAPSKSVTNSAETQSPQSHPAESDAPLGLETQENPAEKTHQSFTKETNTAASSIIAADKDGVVLTDDDEVPRYLARPLPTSGRLDIVITFVSNDGIISGLEASEGT